jgi:hypothetical protein
MILFFCRSFLLTGNTLVKNEKTGQDIPFTRFANASRIRAILQ